MPSASATSSTASRWGRDGTILRTSDAGRGWQSVRTAVGTPLYGLACARAAGMGRGRARHHHHFAPGRHKLGWIKRAGRKKHLYAVCFSDEKTGWAVGVEGTILTTKDGGARWAAQASGVSKASVCRGVRR